MTKQIFTQSQQQEEEEILPKQEFYNVETTIDNEPLEGELLDEQFEQIVKPKSSGWKTALKLTALLFLGVTVAQSVQWIWDSYQNQQWIYLAFALVSFVVVMFGLSEIIADPTTFRPFLTKYSSPLFPTTKISTLSFAFP